MIADAEWPSFDPLLLVDEQVTLAIQVNGKLRDTLTAPRGLDQAATEALALGSDKVQRQLGGAAPRKGIVVPPRRGRFVGGFAAPPPARQPWAGPAWRCHRRCREGRWSC